jgi:hypothetical protein
LREKEGGRGVNAKSRLQQNKIYIKKLRKRAKNSNCRATSFRSLGGEVGKKEEIGSEPDSHGECHYFYVSVCV